MNTDEHRYRSKIKLSRVGIAHRLRTIVVGSAHPTWLRFRGLLTLILILIALARPRWGTSTEPVFRTAGTFWLCVDVSRSMLAEDVPGNRLEHVKRLIQDLFADGFEGKRVGLIAFAGEARVVCPATYDLDHTMEKLENLSIDSAPPGGSNWPSVFRLLSERSAEVDEASSWVLLFSDGGHENFSVESVLANIGRDRWTVFTDRWTVFTFGIGDPATAATIPLPGGSGFLAESGRLVRSRLHEEPLEQLSGNTGGLYVPLRTGDVDLPDIFALRIEPRAKTIAEERAPIMPAERFRWFLLPAFTIASLFWRPGVRKYAVGSRKVGSMQ